MDGTLPALSPLTVTPVAREKGGPLSRTRFAFATLPLLVFLLGSTACDRPPREAVTTTDSAGVPMILSAAPAWSAEEAWRIAPNPLVTVGGLEGQRYYDFRNVRDAGLLDDGTILVTHCSNPPEVRMFSATGSFLRAFGGDGSDIGRCRFILRSWMIDDDALVIYDPTLGRLTQFDLQGRVVEARPVESGPDAPLWLDRLADGRLLGRPNNPQPVEAGRSRASFEYILLDPVSHAVQRVTDAAGAEFVVTGSGNDRHVEQVLFSPFTTAVARGNNIYMSDTRDFWIEERTADGELVRRFGRSWNPESIGRRFIREYSDQRLAAAGAGARAVRQELARAVFAENVPAHEPTMIVDDDDHLWVLHATRGPGGAHVWSVFAPDGRWLGEVTTPARLRITGIERDRLIGVWQEAPDVQTVRVYELDRP
jgi:hypothetical protein